MKNHCKAVGVLYQLKHEIEEQAYEKRKQKVQQLEQVIDDYLIIAPKSLQEIVQEGNTLHHYVGGESYLKQHAEGKTTILFLREKNHPNDPYFTLEYRNQKIVQIQGKYNREQVPEEVNQAVKKWQKVIQHSA